MRVRQLLLVLFAPGFAELFPTTTIAQIYSIYMSIDQATLPGYAGETLNYPYIFTNRRKIEKQMIKNVTFHIAVRIL